MTHEYEPCTHPGRHGYGDDWEFCDRCRQGRTARGHTRSADVCRCGVPVTHHAVLPCPLVARVSEPEPEPEPVHRGHWSRLAATFFCDTCNSPYCEIA